MVIRHCLGLAFMLVLAGHAAGLPAHDRVLPACQPGSAVSEQGFVAIGGIPQWVVIDGADCGNPVVLFVHGGPGNPSSPYADGLYGEWRDAFTLVHWDQRGAGKTFGRTPVSEETPLTIDRLTQDGVEVADYVTRRLGKRQVILFGGSWGSALAVHMAQARPELFSAYVGTSQLVGGRVNPLASWQALRDRVSSAADAATVEMLDAIGAPPWTNPRAFGMVRRATRVYEAAVTEPAPPGWWTPSPAYADPRSLGDYEAGEDYSYLQFVGMRGDGLLSRLDLPALGTKFAMPVVMLQGEHDLVTVPSVSRAYFDSIDAPSKRYILLPRTGHDPNPEMLGAQYAALIALAADSGELLVDRHPEHEQDDRDDHRGPEQELGDAHGGAGDAGEAEQAGDQADDGEDDGPLDHGEGLLSGMGPR